jgi:zinc/manganese transport system permease protein
MVQALALACGFLFVSLYGGFLSETQSLLFGTFLGVSDAQVLTLAAVALGVLGLLCAVGRRLLFSSVDPAGALSQGVSDRRLNLFFLVVLGLAVAEVSQITGALLVFALLVMPASAAGRWTTRPGQGVLLSVALALVVVWVGLAAAFFSPYPAGFWITSAGLVVYVASALRAPAGGPFRLLAHEGRRPA